MNFFNPLAWIGLLSIPTIIVMYLMKQKYKEVEVPSLFLWKQATAMSQSQRPWQKLRRNLLMLLQILLAFLLVFALANPFMASMEETEDYILLLDGSMSMQASDISPSRFDKAKEGMIDLISGAKPGANISVVVANHDPYIAVNFSQDKNALLEKVKAISVSYGGMDREATTSLLTILKEQKDAKVYVFSDDSHIFGDIATEHVYVGGSVNNCAVTLLSHTVDGDRIVVLTKVKNFGQEQVKNSVALYTDEIIFDIKEVTLGAGEEKDIFFVSVPIATKNITAVLRTPDYLAADDQGYDVVNEAGKERVLLLTKQNVFLENMLLLLPNVDLYKGDVENTEGLSGYYLYVFDGVLPETMPTDGHIFIFNPPADNLFIETGKDVKISAIYHDDSTFLKFIGDMDFDVLQSKKIIAPAWSETILSSVDTPLVLAGEITSQKVLVMGFDLHNTDLPLKKEFPIFMYNLMDWFMPNQIADLDRIYTNDLVEFNIYPDAEKVTVVDPMGTAVALAPPFPITPYRGADLPGFYILEQMIAGKGLYTAFPVNVSAEESNLIRESSVQTNRESAGTMVAVNKNLTSIFICIVIVLFLVEWWVYSHGN